MSRGGGEAQLSLPFIVRAVSKTNLLERLGHPLEITDRRVRFTLRPWEIAPNTEIPE